MLEYEFLLVFFIEDVWISGRPDQQNFFFHTFEGRKWKEVQNEGFCHLKAPIWVNALNIAQSHGEDSGGSRTFSSFCWLKILWYARDQQNWENMPNLWCGKPARLPLPELNVLQNPAVRCTKTLRSCWTSMGESTARLRYLGGEVRKVKIFDMTSWPLDICRIGLGVLYLHVFLKGFSRLEL